MRENLEKVFPDKESMDPDVSGSFEECFITAEEKYNLGLEYEIGTEKVKKNLELAISLFQESAEMGHANAAHKLGLYYFNGIGVKKSIGKAIHWFTIASKEGHVESGLRLRVCIALVDQMQEYNDCSHTNIDTALEIQKEKETENQRHRSESSKLLKKRYESVRLEAQTGIRINVLRAFQKIKTCINNTYQDQELSEENKAELENNLEIVSQSLIKEICSVQEKDVLTENNQKEKQREIKNKLLKTYSDCLKIENLRKIILEHSNLLAKELKAIREDKEAIKYYELVLKNSDEEFSVEFFFELGESHLNTGSYKESVQYLCYALELASNVDGVDSDQVNRISKYLDIVDCYFVIDSVYGYPDQGVLVKTYHTMFKEEDIRTREIEKILRGLTRLQEKVESFADEYNNFKIKKDKVSEVIHKIQDKDQFPEARNFMDNDRGKGIIPVVRESREYEWQGSRRRLEEARQQENISQSLKSYTVDLLARIKKEYNWLFNLLPKHTFLSLGSMARNEMCAYSDLEFALLLGEEPKDENIKQHFKMLVGLIELKVLALGETEFELMPGAKVLRKGYRFDEGGNTPFGKEETFFGTKEQLLSSIKDLKNHTGDLITANVLQDAGYLSGDEELFKDYKKDLCTVLQESDRQKIIAMRLLSDHLKDFEVFDSSSDIIDVKKDLLRFPVFFVNCLSLYHGIKYPDIRDNNTAMKINGLVNKGEMDKTTGDIIKTTISYTLSLRNALHLAHGKEKESLQMQDALAKGYQLNNGFNKLVKFFEEIYRTLYQLAKDFIGYYNNIVTDNPCLESIFTEESLSNLKGEDYRKGFMLGVISKNGCRRECTPLSKYNTTNGRST